ncbi:MAG: Trehalose-6-phosphate phosphatase [Candidatus Celerinatantimonas neptuna]|nr:MAG: Trehalose-6-phosphate phosphatase [Candidatus Celerinatantimonas neptuna]
MDLPNLNLNQSAIFFDFDGTLVDIKPTPDQVKIRPQTQSLLIQLNNRLDNALAIISGRSIESLVNCLLKPVPKLSLSGSHGAQYQLSESNFVQLHPKVKAMPLPLVRQCKAFSQKHQLIWEPKPYSIIIHYRNYPELEKEVESYLKNIISDYPDLTIQKGKFICEIKHAGINKSSALKLFMNKPLFYGRNPWYFGDDITDEDAFQWINHHQGISVKIGNYKNSRAKFHLETPYSLIQFFQSSLNLEN